MFQSAITGAERVLEVMDETPDIVDKLDTISVKSFKGNVEFVNVDFSYEKELPILKNIHFQARAGEKNYDYKLINKIL